MPDSQVVAGDATWELRKAIPDAWAGFAALHKAALADGVLSGATKELIALCIAVSKQCDGCISSHARGAARKGATPAEVAEALAVTLLMDGGPATMYAPRAWAAFRAADSRSAEHVNDHDDDAHHRHLADDALLLAEKRRLKGD
jgi:AhpD family alkylhydroperoxidase